MGPTGQVGVEERLRFFIVNGVKQQARGVDFVDAVATMGWYLRATATGRGYGTEAVRAYLGRYHQSKRRRTTSVDERPILDLREPADHFFVGQHGTQRRAPIHRRLELVRQAMVVLVFAHSRIALRLNIGRDRQLGNRPAFLLVVVEPGVVDRKSTRLNSSHRT